MRDIKRVSVGVGNCTIVKLCCDSVCAVVDCIGSQDVKLGGVASTFLSTRQAPSSVYSLVAVTPIHHTNGGAAPKDRAALASHLLRHY